MKTTFLVLFSLLLASCPNKKTDQDKKENNVVENSGSENEQKEIVFTKLYSGSLNGSGGVEKHNRIVSSEKEWEQLTSRFAGAKTAIDFSKSRLLILVDEVRNTGGFSITVDKIIDTEKQLIVYVKNQGPKPTDMVTMAISQPFSIIKIDNTAKEIIFK